LDDDPQLSRQPTRAVVRERLLSRILDGRLGPGEAIKLRGVAEEFGVSVTPVREALFELSTEGLLSLEPWKGFVVRSLETREVLELYPIVWTLEGLAVRSAAVFDRDRLASLRSINERFEDSVGEPRLSAQLDRVWHQTLVEAGANESLLEILRELKVRILRYEFAYLSDSGHLQKSARQHEAIAKALEEGTRDEALRILESNWKYDLTLITSEMTDD
jgi:DNA-binding GntR family transcriptional regulator